MKRRRYETVWDALESTPAEAASMYLRSRLLIATAERVQHLKLTQTQAARRLGITQPRLNDLLRGKIANFSLDTLIDLATRAGLSVRMEIEGTT